MNRYRFAELTSSPYQTPLLVVEVDERYFVSLEGNHSGLTAIVRDGGNSPHAWLNSLRGRQEFFGSKELLNDFVFLQLLASEEIMATDIADKAYEPNMLKSISRTFSPVKHIGPKLAKFIDDCITIATNPHRG